MISAEKTYREMNIATASPMQLILMLYDECLKSLDLAEKAFAISGPERIEQISNHMLHAQDVVTELAIALDFEKGGEIAHNLHRLYDFMIKHMSHANVKKDLKALQDVRRLILELREAWTEVARNEPARDEVPVRASSGILVSG